MIESPEITVLLPGDKTVSMWIHHTRIRQQVRSYRTKEPLMVWQYGSQWVCSCGHRGTITMKRNVAEFERIDAGPVFNKWRLIMNWASHANLMHIHVKHLRRALHKKIDSEFYKEKYAV